MHRPDYALLLQLRQGSAQGVTADLQQFAQCPLARQPLAPRAALDLRMQETRGLGDERLSLRQARGAHARSVWKPTANSSLKKRFPGTAGASLSCDAAAPSIPDDFLSPAIESGGESSEPLRIAHRNIAK